MGLSQPITWNFYCLRNCGISHAVKLFPAEACSCPSTSRCYHIIAARLSIGLSAEDVHKTKNISYPAKKE